MTVPETVKRRMLERLQFIYGGKVAGELLDSQCALLKKYAPHMTRRPSGWSQADALLITYGDTIVDDSRPSLQALDRFLRSNVGDLITFLHILPVFPYSSDDGFAVTDFLSVRPELGDWADIRELAGRYRLVLDAVINHVSASSNYMRGYCVGNSKYDEFFISLPPGADTSSVLRTRDLPLLHEYDTRDGKQRLWTTFGPDQVDLNFANPKVLLEILDVLLFYAAQGASMLRLDAIPYLWKELGTSCAHLPQTHELIKLFRDALDAVAPWVILLAESNVPSRENIQYLGAQGDEAQLIYNFPLAPLIVFSINRGRSAKLTEWAKSIEPLEGRTAWLNVTATHDGIGVRPTEGLLTEPERRELLDLAAAHHGFVTGKKNPDGSTSPYELNLNYFDAVNHPDSPEPLDTQIARFVLSQAIPLALRGIPAIYIHSLLGSRNDLSGVRESGRPRSINRRKLQLAELQEELDDENSLRHRVFSALARMLRLRREESAFHPDAGQEALDLGPSVFAVRRHNAGTGETIVALHNVTGSNLVLACPKALPASNCSDVLSGESLSSASDSIPLAPYQVRWIKPLE